MVGSAVFSPHHHLIRKLESVSKLSEAEREALSGLPLTVQSVSEDQEIFRDHDAPGRCCLLIDGFMHRYRLLENGGRQILSFHLPGDIVDLQTLLLGTMDHSIGTLVRSRVAFIPNTALLGLMKEHPGIAQALWRDSLVDAAVFREWIVNVGRRHSQARIAHLFCEIYVRMQTLGLAQPDGFMLLLTQAEIADATGITAVHVNRTLQEMRTRGLVASEGRYLRIPNLTRLKEAAGFDPVYLHLRKAG